MLTSVSSKQKINFKNYEKDECKKGAEESMQYNLLNFNQGFQTGF